jgi:predicted phosphodiesterase
MKFQIISDIHLEYYNTLPEIKYFFDISAPNIILAGDICYYKHPNFMLFFDKIAKLYEKVFFVPGNHDYYAHDNIPECGFDQIDFIMKENLKVFKNVYFIQNSIFEFDNNIILGNTLWCKTNRTIMYNNVKIITSEFYIKYKHKFMPSFKSIKKVNTFQYNWLKNTLKAIQNTPKNIIVITHYLPSKKCIHKKYKKNDYNDLYFTNCEDLLPFCNCWVAGHTHDPFIGKINGCDVLVNPRGDPNETTGYDKNLVLSSDIPTHAHL